MRRSSAIQWVRAGVLFTTFTLLVVVVGCARPVGSITGKVTYKDKPLKGGYVTFISTEGQPSKPAEIMEDGTYSVASITAGSYKVCVETDSLRAKSMPNVGGKPIQKVEDPAAKKEFNLPVPEYKGSSPAEAAIESHNKKNAPRFIQIPGHYKSSDTTDLSYTVVGGAQTHDIILK